MRKISECYRKLEWSKIAKKGIVRKGGYFVELFMSDKLLIEFRTSNGEHINFFASKDGLYCDRESYERLK